MNAPHPAPDSPSGRITLRYWAAAKAAAGVESDVIEVAGPVDLAWLVAQSVERHGAANRLPDVLDCCSVLIGDQPASSADRASVTVLPGSRVEFLPPFAGG